MRDREEGSQESLVTRCRGGTLPVPEERRSSLARFNPIQGMRKR